ncbi:hypothetical protein KAJ61_02055 [Candidatus Parcubacteria bacterium]|nr:hypothetical protein [Candidatus Parcubacteria bacterium]
MAVKVATQGGEVKDVKFEDRMRLRDALDAANIKPDTGATITVNGEDVKGMFKMRSGLNDGDTIVITPKVGNG